MDLEELRQEYGRINRAHVTVMAALTEYKTSHENTVDAYGVSTADKIIHAAAVMGACEVRLKKLIEEKKHEDTDVDNVSGAPV